MPELNIAGIIRETIVDGPGLRFTLFVQGCPHKCIGCHNPKTHSFDGGKKVDIKKIEKEILKNPLLKGVTFSGGEPFCQSENLSLLGKKLKENGLDIVTYTGYTFEYLFENSNEKNHYMDLLKITDILIDGPFILEQKSLALKFRGSKNQRIIDCQKSLKEEKVVIRDLTY